MADGKVVINTALDNKGLEKGIKSVSGAFGGLKTVLGGLVLSITAALGAAAIAITKQATDAYADYEQLTGGMETMFKGSASKIAKYAEDAFYTAGVSANTYMDIVTSFSASLISSLSGDTETAADVANMALMDMSDNANKMGNSLESVQEAYKGFSKQQYQLLDNLRLGYGGSKTEMERLLHDAEAYSGIKYDINNLADVYNAIHVVQEQLGITGTTAKEAEKTITGSANMMKAAWQNVLAAISGGGDLDKSINNLVYSISKYFENIVPVVERSLRGIGQLIEKIAPQLVQTVAVALIKAIPSLLSAVYQMIIGLAKGIYQGIVALFTGKSFSSEIKASLNDVSSGFASATDGAESLEEATEAAGKAAKKSLTGFDELNMLSDASGGSGADSGASAGDGGGVGSVPTTVSVEADVSLGEETVSPGMQKIIEKIRELLAPLQEIDFSPLKESVRGLWDAFKNLASVLGGVFLWAWENVLVPLAEWTIEEAAPALVEALAAAFDATAATLETLFNSVKECWDELQPIFTWIGDTVLVILTDLKEIGQRIAQKWKENEPKLKKTFQNIGTVIQKVWAVVGPILTWIRDALSTLVKDGVIDELQLLFDRLFAISEILAGIVTLDIKQIFNGLSAAVGAETDYAESKIKSFANTLGIDLGAADQFVKGVAEDIGKFFTDAWQDISDCWEDAGDWFNENVVEPIQEFFAPLVEWFGELWGSIQQTIDDVCYNIGVIAEGLWTYIEEIFSIASGWFDQNVIQPVSDFFEELWNDISSWASETWSEIKAFFEPAVTWFDQNIIQPISDFFEGLWDDVSSWASDAWDDIKEAFSEAKDWFKGILNGVISSLNRGLSTIFGGINSALDSLKNFKIGDSQPFANIRTIHVPQIPYLAKGAVLPANKPFMAVVGDQKHGTNVEAPLTVIQEAVAAVMGEYIGANMAGHQATVAVLRETLEAVLGISIGDDVIATAVQRYDRKMAVMRGG